MQAAAGDRLRVRGHIVGQSRALVFPGPDAVVEHSRKRERSGRRKAE
jgi:hypothetical protein